MFRATARLLRSRLAVSKGDGAGGAGLTLSGNALMRGERADVTVIWCHGLGDTAEGMAGLFVADGITFQSDAVKVVLPTASSNPVTLNNGMLMPSWYDITGLDRTTACNQQDLWASVQRVQKLVDQEHAETKVVVGGFSQGGAVALSAALQSSSDNLVAIIAASCYLPLDLDSFDGEAVKRFMPNRALSRPVCVCHGDEDLTVRSLWGEGSVSALRHLGVLDVRWHLFEGMGHEARPDELRVISKFIDEVTKEAEAAICL
mmetsp:Transcript_24502/g.82488  ORF Transcript_24502/g.82488 Transcript_24502/m.82488 type:complete len:260 (+) Transcript_24502:37-816(+)